MTYGPQRIQQQGWAFNFREEAQSSSREPQESKRQPRQKSGPVVDCKNCGKPFKQEHRSSGGSYCSRSCSSDSRRVRSDRITCTFCHVKLGMTVSASALLLGIKRSSLFHLRKRNGIESIPFVEAIRIGHKKKIKAKPCEASIAYEKAAMDDIRSHRRFPDWSYVWQKDVATRKSKSIYQSMSPRERKERNRIAVSRRDKNRQRQYMSEWKRKRSASDPIYRMINGFRSRLSVLVRSKSERTLELIGCSPIQLRHHLESRFKRGMTWDNYGKHWQVDHILPCASFDHSIASHRKQCWHFTNLQPLESWMNHEKSDKITEPQLSLLI